MAELRRAGRVGQPHRRVPVAQPARRRVKHGQGAPDPPGQAEREDDRQGQGAGCDGHQAQPERPQTVFEPLGGPQQGHDAQVPAVAADGHDDQDPVVRHLGKGTARPQCALDEGARDRERGARLPDDGAPGGQDGGAAGGPADGGQVLAQLAVVQMVSEQLLGCGRRRPGLRLGVFYVSGVVVRGRLESEGRDRPDQDQRRQPEEGEQEAASQRGSASRKTRP
jgi:hypothetical protein